MSDKCPFCGAKYMPYFDDYECKTFRERSRAWNRGEQCYECQIAALQERLEALQTKLDELGLCYNELAEVSSQRLEAWRTVVKELDYDGTYFSAHIDWEKLHLLKDLKEIK